jgi:secreted trypsin-like serine protease
MRITLLLAAAALTGACDASANAPQAEQPDQAAQAQGPAQPAKPLASALAYGAPWQAEIYSGYAYTDEELKGRPRWDVAHRCGGSYIKAHWVLTAAHCFYKKHSEDMTTWKENNWRIRLGARDLPSGEGISFAIDRVVIYPGFVHASYTNDVALVHFVADAQSRADYAKRDSAKHVATIRLDGSADGDEPLRLGVAVTVSGWGKTENREDASTNPHLDAATIHTVDCDWGGTYKGKTTGNNLCAFGKARDACQGDSGGPLVRAGGEPVLVGVVSWGTDCGVNGGVYARIDRGHYLDWIDREVGGLPSPRRN